MTNQPDTSTSNTIKKSPWVTTVLLLVSVYLIIEIAKSGYAFGQWLQNAVN